MDRGETARAHSFERTCGRSRIEYRPTRPHPPEASVQRDHDDGRDVRRGHLALVL